MKTANRAVNFDPQGTFLQKRLTSELTWTATQTPGVEKKLQVAGNESSMLRQKTSILSCPSSRASIACTKLLIVMYSRLCGNDNFYGL